jgi:hypothetical protein
MGSGRRVRIFDSVAGRCADVLRCVRPTQRSPLRSKDLRGSLQTRGPARWVVVFRDQTLVRCHAEQSDHRDGLRSGPSLAHPRSVQIQSSAARTISRPQKEIAQTSERT